MGKRAWGAHLPHTATPISPFCAQRLGLGMVVVKDGSRWVSWKQVPGLVGCFFFFDGKKLAFHESLSLVI